MTNLWQTGLGFALIITEDGVGFFVVFFFLRRQECDILGYSFLLHAFDLELWLDHPSLALFFSFC